MNGYVSCYEDFPSRYSFCGEDARVIDVYPFLNLPKKRNYYHVAKKTPNKKTYIRLLQRPLVKNLMYPLLSKKKMVHVSLDICKEPPPLSNPNSKSIGKVVHGTARILPTPPGKGISINGPSVKTRTRFPDKKLHPLLLLVKVRKILWLSKIVPLMSPLMMRWLCIYLMSILSL